MKNKTTIYLKHYITQEEHLDIAEKIGDAGVLLYMHYLRMACMDHPHITDSNAAFSLGWTERKARRYRMALTKEGYFKQIKRTSRDGVCRIEYHIGQEAVQNIKRYRIHKERG